MSPGPTALHDRGVVAERDVTLAELGLRFVEELG